MAKKGGKKSKKTKPKKVNPVKQEQSPKKFPGVGHILGSSKNSTGSGKIQEKPNPSSQQDVDAAINLTLRLVLEVLIIYR